MYKLVFVVLIAALALPTDAFILGSYNIQKTFGASVPVATSTSTSSRYLPAGSSSTTTTFDANALIQSKLNVVTSLVNSLVQLKTSIKNSLLQSVTNAVSSASNSVSNLSSASSQNPSIYTKTITFNKGYGGTVAATAAAPVATAQPSSGYAYRTYKYRV